ncbi:MAG: D-glycero-beta-D-manno-heptose-7-phosphate kinase [Proteobacteria bacterium]|nr:D-glycero-beta-D-manno-heptose-7-phosphate kinase [Desulfobacterales bacterium]MBL6966901.1 D-glycero-beta-D-manno-heptose-7-phosphate kinase [Desulfobacteraceae bacterium]MBU0735217.1 D-glycero-beta-D-manno-heptose-7-phosphate kinase [Pseudomonadota bacterium]MBL7101224.1 D-glycero-beta-D-manno-heptose-7-phosphate kinase [Desulfobacteraceae bacterium]MBL7172056.1 D-glycero-beta-D-manno-heptose-7-phosphate kinase [Desulfobacteraceae bacterium]
MPEINGNYYDAEALKQYIDRFVKARVLVLGDIIMDHYIWGDVTRISPEAPVPVVEVKQETKMLGGAANVIRNMATLGARPVLCGVVGDDSTGQEILSALTHMALKTDGVVSEKGRLTSIKTRIVAHNQQVVRFDRESRAPVRPESIQKVLDFISENLDTIDTIVISDYGKGLISGPLMMGMRELARSGAGRRTIIAVDPKTGNFEYYQGVDVITPNHHEAGIYCGFQIVDEDTLMRAGRQMLSNLNCRSVLITQGKDGMTFFEKHGETTHIPTVAKKVFDVTGAGDTVIATIALGLAAGLDFKSAAILSNFAAGIVVGEVGTSAVKAEDLKKAIGE